MISAHTFAYISLDAMIPQEADQTHMEYGFPVLILGVSDYARIKTESKPKIGQPGEPVAELTKFGWTILLPGKEMDLSNMLLTQTAAADYERLC